MAESKSRSKSGSSRKSGSSSQRKSGGSSSQGKSGSSRQGKSGSSSRESADRSPREIVMEAAVQAQELIGRPIESVTGIDRNGKQWTITLEVVELERIPSTTDVLGSYEITVDREGELTGITRTRRYPRASAGED